MSAILLLFVKRVSSEALFDTLLGKEDIALRVGRIIDRYQMRKHFDLVFGCRHTCSTPGSQGMTLVMETDPTPWQSKVMDLLKEYIPGTVYPVNAPPS